MLVLDINVLVGAHHAEAHDHAAMRKWMQDLIGSSASFGFPDFVLFNFIRVVTLPRPWTRPSTTREALDFCASIVMSPSFIMLEPSGEQWSVFDTLCRRINARGNVVNDAYLAAHAIHFNAELITLDQDFVKFPNLRWRGPFDTQSRTNPR